LLPSIDNGLGEQLQPAAKLNELAAHRPDRRPVVAAEVGDGLEVRRQAPGQPHQLDIALSFSLKATAGLYSVQIAVEINLQQGRRVIGRPSRRCRMNTGKAKSTKIKLVDKDFNDPNRVVRGDVIVQRLGQQKRLSAVFTFDETPHRQPSEIEPILADSGAFLHSLDPSQSYGEQNTLPESSRTFMFARSARTGAKSRISRLVRDPAGMPKAQLGWRSPTLSLN
jgi:hypothetical protein